MGGSPWINPGRGLFYSGNFDASVQVVTRDVLKDPVHIPDAQAYLIVRALRNHVIPIPTNVTTEEIWATYILHEFRHIIDHRRIDQWIQANQNRILAGKSADPLFERYVRLHVPVEGPKQFVIDVAFAELFLESQAYRFELHLANVLGNSDQQDKVRQAFNEYLGGSPAQSIFSFFDITTLQDAFLIGETIAKTMDATIIGY